MPATKIFIARHGERIDHVDPTWKVSARRPHDPHLTRTGILQASALGKKLKDENITQIYVSPFLRTLQTAHHANQAMGATADMFIETGICEYLNPSWFPNEPTFLPIEEITQLGMSVVEEYTPVTAVAYPETREMVFERAGSCARALAEKGHGNILLIGHGITCEVTARGLCNVGEREYIRYCGLQTCTKKKNGWVVGDVEIEFMPPEIRPKGRGGIAFIGGPVSAISFHPNAPGICLTAAHNKTNPTHILHKCYEGPAIIQLWHFSLSNKSPKTKCLGLIPHNGDCTFDLKWRPDNSRTLSTRWSGTFAAALGDGSVIVCHLDFEDIPTADSHTEGTAPRLEPTTIVLRRNNARSPVRVVEWSPDGKRLVVGSANGNVEVYEADSHDACWPSWTIPAQESVISDIRWLSPKLYCTLGMSCVLRLCDVRDPIATLEQNCEGLQGSLSMAMLEPNVAAVGADSGYLRVVRLSAIDQVTAQNPVRRVYLQTSSFRDMRSVSFSEMTVLYTGGSEGILHQVIFPKPLWPLKGACKIDKTRISERLRWDIDGDVMHLQLNPPHVEKGKKKRGAAGREITGALFGERYKQPIVVTRIAVNAQNNVIAVGIDGGFITWLPINTTSSNHATPVVEEDEHMFSTAHLSMNGETRQPEEPNGDIISLDPSPSLKNIPFKVKLKKEAKRPIFGPKRKRGRPRKVIIDDANKTEKQEKQTGGETGAKHGTVDVPKNTDKRARTPPEETEAPTPAERPRRTGKRGRPRKNHGTPAIQPVEVVEEQATDGKRKPRKRRRTHASDSNAEEEESAQVKDRQADQEHEEAVPPQDTEAGDGVVSTPRSTTSRPKALEPSANHAIARPSQREQQPHHGMSIPLRLPIRKPKWRLPELVGELPQFMRMSPRRRKLNAEANALQLERDIRARAYQKQKRARASHAPANTEGSAKASASDLSAKTSVASHSLAIATPSVTKEGIVSDSPPPKPKPKPQPDSSNEAPAAARRVKLVIRKTVSAPSPSEKPDVITASGINEGSTSIPVCLRIRKRRAEDIGEPVDRREQSPKRSKIDPQVVDQGTPTGPVAESWKGLKKAMTTPQVVDEATHSSDIAKNRTAALENAGQRPAETPVRSTRVRKPSWRVRGD